jgi:aminomethyltransferase
MAQTESAQALRRTPLYAMHVRLGARMVPFAGYEMPVQYPGGIIKEHLHTRTAASLFDVSHMGQIALRPRSGRGEDVARALETLVPGDIVGLTARRQRYTLFTDPAGGVLDDLMVSNQGGHLMLVVNAACKEADEAHLRAHVAHVCEIERLADRALVALQGPLAEAALARLAPGGRRVQVHGRPRGRVDGRALPGEPFRLYRGGRFRDQRAGRARRSALQ